MENLKILLKEFQIPKKEYGFETISNGLINDTYLVKDAGEPTYIFQRINIKVFTNYEALIHNLDLVLPLLKSNTYSEVVLFIKESVVYNTTENPKIAFEAGSVIAQFHKLTEGFDADRLEDTLLRFHDINLRYDQFKNPSRVCHNDTKLNNILFSKEDKALCLIDLDTIMKGVFIYDFGDAIRTIANAAPEDEKDLDKINFNLDLFSSFIEGLATEKDLFQEEEKIMMPRGAVLMPFLHGIRALTDYLENNRYYKVAYETQNLDRCFSLFQFAQLALDNQEAMTQIISDKL